MSGIGQEGSRRAERGRPKKKPGYDREKEIADLVQQAADLFLIPYDDRNDRPPDAPSIKSVAEVMNTSRVRLKKLLITAGYYSTASSRLVQSLLEKGYSIEQICVETGLSKAGVAALLPYKRGAYNLVDPPPYAENCRLFRKRKRACEILTDHLDDEGCCRYLWDAVEAFEKYPFRTQHNQKVRYVLERGKLCIGDRQYCRKEIEDAYYRIRKVQRAQGQVTKENCECCVELYTIFLRIGACHC